VGVLVAVGDGELVGDALLVGVAEGETVLVGWGAREAVGEGDGEGDFFFAGAWIGSAVLVGTTESDSVSESVGDNSLMMRNPGLMDWSPFVLVRFQ
jgi:hypothetical protein